MSGSIKEAMQHIAGSMALGIVEGVVVNESPLTVTLVDDLKIRLSEASLIIPSEKRPLKKDERFYLLALSKNKIYYILDRK